MLVDHALINSRVLVYLKQPSRAKKFNQMVHEYCDYNKLEHNYLHQINIANVPYTIDITSVDYSNLIQTVGTYTELRSSQMQNFMEG